MVTASQPAEAFLLMLATHYRLVDLRLFAGTGVPQEGLFERLVATGALTPAHVAFLERKADRLAHPISASGRFLDKGQELGYLTSSAIREFVAPALDAGSQGDYHAAALCHGLGLLDLRQVVDVLEETGLPLLYCPDCRVAHHPARDAELDAQAACPACQLRLEALTWLPARGLAGPPLPNISRLKIQPLAPRLAGGRAHLVVQLARRYGLIRDEQASLLADRTPESPPAMAQAMLEEGFLTTAEFRFLLARSEEVGETGTGATGRASGAELLDLAVALGYLRPGARAELLQHQLVGQMADFGAGRDAVVVQLLYNLHYIRFWQAADLLEKKGLLLDHCPACQVQWTVRGKGPAACPDCGGAMVRLTGWETEEELAQPLPIPARLAIHRTPDLAEAMEAGMSSSLVLPAVDEAAPEAEDDAVRRLVLHYRLLEPDQLSRAERLAERSSLPLLQVLVQVGYIPPPPAPSCAAASASPPTLPRTPACWGSRCTAGISPPAWSRAGTPPSCTSSSSSRWSRARTTSGT